MGLARADHLEALELARYTVTDGERVLYRHWLEAGVRVIDAPANGCGHTFIVDELSDEGFGALRALVADYLKQAAVHNHIPALGPVLDPMW